MNGYRIAMVVDHCLPRIGGIETQVSELARQLIARGHQVTIVTTMPGDTVLDSVPIVRLPALLIPNVQVVWTLPPLWRLRRFLVENAFDVIHCHNSVYSPLAYSGLFWSQQLKIPAVLTTHSVLQKTGRIFRAMDRFVKWREWPVVWSTVSRFNTELLRANAGLEDVAVVPNGVQCRDWRMEARPHSYLRVTSLLRLNRTKRPEQLIEAIPTVLRQWKGGQEVRFTIIGDGPLRESLTNLARKLGVSQNVEFLGSLKRDEIQNVFATTDLVAHPTSRETFGIAVLEALAAGLPVVAMEGCGVSDLFSDGEAGFLAADRDAFAERILELLRDAELRSRMSAAALVAAQQFDWEHVVPQQLALYERAMQTAQ